VLTEAGIRRKAPVAFSERERADRSMNVPPVTLVRPVGYVLFDEDELIGLRKRQRRKEDVTNQRKDQRVRGNCDRDRGDCRDEKYRPVPPATKPVPHVSKHARHELFDASGLLAVSGLSAL
jgi:hypothetical protein